MEYKTKSIRPFIGAKDYKISRQFYTDLGFEEIILEDKMSLFKLGDFGFYLQGSYIKDWIDNSMIFLEVENLELHLQNIKNLELDKKYDSLRLTEIKYNDWGNEFFIYDPSGILWHIGEFKNQKT